MKHERYNSYHGEDEEPKAPRLPPTRSNKLPSLPALRCNVMPYLDQLDAVPRKWLTEWERDFINDIQRLTKRFGKFSCSDKQAKHLQEILKKYRSLKKFRQKQGGPRRT